MLNIFIIYLKFNLLIIINAKHIKTYLLGCYLIDINKVLLIIIKKYKTAQNIIQN